MLSRAPLILKCCKYLGSGALIYQDRAHTYTVKVNGRCMALAVSKATSSSAGSQKPRTAGLIIIGDEILKGQVHDTNSHFISKTLYDLGVKLKRIIVIGDSTDEIVKEVRESSSKFTFVITCGGIGSTHDDVTYEAIGKAFNEPLIPHPELVQICKGHFKTNDLNAPAMKLAHVPKSARLTFGYDKVKKRRTLYPNVSVANVYVFPGVPQLLERLFSAVCVELFGGGSCKFYLQEMFISLDETKLVCCLNAVVQEFPTVTFGSYPEFDNSFYRVRITIESQVENDVKAAYEKLRSAIPQDCIVNYDKTPLDHAYEKLIKFANEGQKKHLLNSIRMLEECCQKYNPEEVCIYLDGEKESTAVLHLYFACLKKLKIDSSIKALSVKQKSCSHEMETYIEQTTPLYNLKNEILTCQGTVASIVQQYLKSHTEIKVLVTGSTLSARKVEFGSLSADCPHVKLVHPFATWTSPEVWDIVISLYLPHCRSNV